MAQLYVSSGPQRYQSNCNSRPSFVNLTPSPRTCAAPVLRRSLTHTWRSSAAPHATIQPHTLGESLVWKKHSRRRRLVYVHTPKLHSISKDGKMSLWLGAIGPIMGLSRTHCVPSTPSKPSSGSYCQPSKQKNGHIGGLSFIEPQKANNTQSPCKAVPRDQMTPKVVPPISSSDIRPQDDLNEIHGSKAPFKGNV